VWEFEALLHDVFGASPPFATYAKRTDTTAQDMAVGPRDVGRLHLHVLERAPLDALTEFTDAPRVVIWELSNARHDQRPLHLVQPTKREFLVQVRGTAGFTLACLKPVR
jgi:hypothetical protein